MQRSVFEAVCEAPFAALPRTVSDRARLSYVRTTHTAIYVLMAAATMVILHSGVTGSSGPVLWTALCLMAVEVTFFAGNGFRCPLTTLAVKYGAESGRVGDTFLPERVTRHTFRFFGSAMGIGLCLIVLRAVGVL